MYNFQVPDPQTNSMRRMIEEPKVDQRGFICIYQTIQSSQTNDSKRVSNNLRRSRTS